MVEPVVRGEPAEELGHPGPRADAPADLGGVVEHRAPGHPTHELEHVPETPADALGGLAPEHLREADAGMREGSRQVLPPDGDAPHPEVRLAEVDLALAGEPAELQEALGVAPVALLGHLLAPEPHVAPRGGVGALVAALLPQPGVHLRRGMALLAPVAEVAVEPRIYVRDMWGEQLAPRSAPPRALRGQVLHPQVLPDGGLRHPGLPRDRGDGLAPPTPSSYILYLAHADHSYSDLPYGAVCRQATYDWPPRGVVGMPMLISAIFSCRKPKLLVLKSPTRRLSKTRDMPCRHGVAPARWRAASRTQARSSIAWASSRSPPACSGGTQTGLTSPARASRARRFRVAPVVLPGARVGRAGRPRGGHGLHQRVATRRRPYRHESARPPSHAPWDGRGRPAARSAISPWSLPPGVRVPGSPSSGAGAHVVVAHGWLSTPRYARWMAMGTLPSVVAPRRRSAATEPSRLTGGSPLGPDPE